MQATFSFGSAVGGTAWRAGVLVLLCVGCSRPARPVDPVPPPRAVAGRQLFVTPNLYSALSSVVSFDGRGIDSARVAYWADREPRQVTLFAAASGAERIVVLG